MIQLHQFPKGPEYLNAQHQDDHEGAQFQVAVGNPYGAPAEGHRRAAGDSEDGQRASRRVGCEDAHGGAEEHPRPLCQQFATGPALAEGLEGGQTLYCVEEVRAQGSVCVPAGHAAFAVPPVKHVGNYQGQQGEGQEYQPRLQINKGHEYEDRHRGQRGDDHLRQVTPKERLQPLHALGQRHQRITRAGGIEMPRPQGQRVFVQALAQLHLDQAGSMMAHHLLQVLQAGPRHDQRGHYHQRPGKRFKGGVAANHLYDDHGCNGQSGHACSRCQHAHNRGYDDAPTNVRGQCQQPRVQIHCYITSPYGLPSRDNRTPWPVGLLWIDCTALPLEHRTDVDVGKGIRVTAQCRNHDLHILPHKAQV